MRQRWSNRVSSRVGTGKALLVPPTRWVVLVVVLGIIGAYDLIVAQLVPAEWKTKFQPLVEIAPNWPWERWAMIFLSVLLVIVFERAHRQLSALQHPKRQPPPNRADIIASFTELGYSASSLTNSRKRDKFFSKFTNDENPFFVSDDTKDARVRYREAALETEKQINIAGGELRRPLRLRKEEIMSRILSDKFVIEGEDPLDPEPPNIGDSVRRAIDDVNNGLWSTDN